MINITTSKTNSIRRELSNYIIYKLAVSPIVYTEYKKKLLRPEFSIFSSLYTLSYQIEVEDESHDD